MKSAKGLNMTTSSLAATPNYSTVDIAVLVQQIDDLTAQQISPMIADTPAREIEFKLYILHDLLFRFVIKNPDVLASMTALYASFKQELKNE